MYILIYKLFIKMFSLLINTHSISGRMHTYTRFDIFVYKIRNRIFVYKIRNIPCKSSTKA